MRINNIFLLHVCFFMQFVLPVVKLAANELNPIDPRKRRSSCNATYCCVRYCDAVATPDGPVVYICGVGDRSPGSSIIDGTTLELQGSTGDVGHYHICGDAGVSMGDNVVYTVTEKKPAKHWLYDGKEQSLITISARSLSETPETRSIRVYQKDGTPNAARTDLLGKQLAAIGLDLSDDASWAWLNEDSRTLYIVAREKICFRVDLDTNKGAMIDFDEALQLGLQTASCRDDILSYLARYPSSVSSNDVIDVAENQLLASSERVRAAYIAALLGDLRSKPILFEFSQHTSESVRAWANEGIAVSDLIGQKQ